MRPTSLRRRRGFTLIELITATAMLAALSATSVVLLRSSQSAWKLHRDDLAVRQSALATLRHVARMVRQSVRVTAISAATETSGSLELALADGTRIAYGHDAGSQQALYGENTADSLLANYVKTLKFTGLKADGSSATTETDLIHSVRCTVTYDLLRPTGTTTETLSCTAWLRSW